MRFVGNLAAGFTLLLTLTAATDFAAGDGWKAGLARAKITPQESLWMAGYAARDHAAEDAEHDLWLKVLALEAPDGGKAVIVATDLLGFPKDLADRIRTQLQARCGLARSQIMLTSTHTHCGPVIRHGLLDIYPLDDLQRERIERYSAELEKTVVATTAEALAQMTPATLWAGEGTCDFAVNRRNNSEAEVAAVRAAGGTPKGPTDHGVSVLAVRGPDGSLRAVMFGYACHNTTLAYYQWCGDYAGFAQLAVEAGHPGATAMFAMGCGADQNPIPRRTVELCREYGERLATSVDQVLGQPMRPVPARVRTAMKTLPLRFQDVPSEAELAEKAKAGGFVGRWASRLLDERRAGKTWPTEYPYPIQVWRLGDDQWWIVLGGEVVVDYALRFKAEYGPTTWVTAYANDVMAYIPSHRVWQEGGYESGAFNVYGLPANRWEETIEDRIAAGVAELRESLK